MADVILDVQILNVEEEASVFLFTPNKLFTRVEGLFENDPNFAVLYYELFNDAPINGEKYISREWVDKGRVKLPMAALQAANFGGDLNEAAVNQILSSFNLKYAPAPKAE